ncbi:MAG TPA: rhodanese-like domain-containing protein, partial [Thermoanaerobaculia bacterium]|nr:rhodanese-like domain-containing protein [Thermoanaerobaculia bacterium]
QATPNPNLQITYPNPDDELATARRIPREEAIKMVKEGKAVYIDVRSKDAYDAGHIPGAMSVPLNELQSELNKLPKRKFLIPYCS